MDGPPTGHPCSGGTIKRARAPTSTKSGDSTNGRAHRTGWGARRDERYVVERFKAMANGDVRRIDAKPAKKGRAKRTIASRAEVEQIRPERTEIVICTGLRIKGAGVQLWGAIATGLFCDRRQR